MPNAGIDKTKIILQNKKKINGRGNIPNLKAIARPEKKKAIFISRIDPGVSAETMDRYVSTITTGGVCTRMKTRHETYASFHIEVLEKEFDLVFDAARWPEHCIITEFRGRLREYQIWDEGKINAANVGEAKDSFLVEGKDSSSRP